MRAEWEFHAKLAETSEPLFAERLRWAIGPPLKSARQIRARLILAQDMTFKGKYKRVMHWGEIAGFYKWMLEPPAPVIDEERRAEAQETANKANSCRYIRADAKGTQVSTKPVGDYTKWELIEPQKGRR